MTKTVSLSTPLDLPCGQVLPNRIMKSALSEGLGTAHHAPDVRLERLYARWAAGGYGLIVTGNVMVDRRISANRATSSSRTTANSTHFQRWAKTAQDGGSPIWVQLNHPGRQANPITTDGPTVAPSAVKLDIPGIPTPRELTDTEIRDIIERFAVPRRHRRGRRVRRRPDPRRARLSHLPVPLTPGQQAIRPLGWLDGEPRTVRPGDHPAGPRSRRSAGLPSVSN